MSRIPFWKRTTLRGSLSFVSLLFIIIVKAVHLRFSKCYNCKRVGSSCFHWPRCDKCLNNKLTKWIIAKRTLHLIVTRHAENSWPDIERKISYWSFLRFDLRCLNFKRPQGNYSLWRYVNIRFNWNSGGGHCFPKHFEPSRYKHRILSPRHTGSWNTNL